MGNIILLLRDLPVADELSVPLCRRPACTCWNNCEVPSREIPHICKLLDSPKPPPLCLKNIEGFYRMFNQFTHHPKTDDKFILTEHS